jgi:hypothetical protein
MVDKIKLSLNDISHKFYDIINNDDDDTFTNLSLKNIITEYYESINNKKINNNDKIIYYNDNIKNPRDTQNNNYNSYLIEREKIYNEWLSNKNIENLKNLSNYKKFDFKYFPNIYTFDIEINHNLDLSKKDIKQDEIKQDEIKQDEIKQHEKQTKNLCTDKKNKECIDKDKVCNPDSGRCVAKLKNKPKQDQIEKFDNKSKKDEIKQDEIEEDEIEEDEIKQDEKQTKNLCTDKKNKECIDKGKVCNPDSGRCVAKLKNKPKQDQIEKFDNKPKKDEIKQDEIEQDEIEQDEIKQDEKQTKNLCTDKKNKECIDKDKVCNPDSGRCVAKLKNKPKQDQIEKFDNKPKKDEIKQDEKQTKNLCTDKKNKECIDKGKVCNPDSGRCVAKLKK